MLWAEAERGWALYYFELNGLSLRDGVPQGIGARIEVFRDQARWFEIKESGQFQLGELDVILMRKDPPFNQEYVYATYILEHAARLGALVVNKPQALRDCNEKVMTALFPQCAPPTLVTRSVAQLHAFWDEHSDIVCKPLDSMGGERIFRLQANDVNASAIFTTLTQGETSYMMAQRYIPEITQGDKRILLINGQPVEYALARIPQGKDWRGNLAVGARGDVQPLSDRDRWICEQVGAAMRDRGLYFVGLDVIGDYLTEINVTSPTGIQEIEQGAGVKVSENLMDVIQHELSSRSISTE